MTLVLAFGVRRIHSGEQHAVTEMRDAHRYYWLSRWLGGGDGK